MQAPPPSSHRQCFPAEIMTHGVRLSSRFPLSEHGVEELLFERGVIVSYETIRGWCPICVLVFFGALCRRCSQPNGMWRLGDRRITMNGRAS